MTDVAGRGAWEDAFVDALCEPLDLFAHGDVLAHVLGYGAVRRHLLGTVLHELGADTPARAGDPILRGR